MMPRGKLMIHGKKMRMFLVAAALIATFILVYSPHFDYRYPLHVDEWQHIAKAVHLIKNREIVENNPYFYWGSYSPNVERGMTVFLAELTLLTDLDPVIYYRFLPALFAVFTAFAIFTAVYSLTKEFYTSLFSIIFLAALKSNINIMGLWFFSPLTFSFPFICLSIPLFITGMREKDNPRMIISFAFLMLLSFIQPLSAVFVFIIFSLFMAMNADLIRKNRHALLLFLLIPLFIFAYFLNIFWEDSLAGILRRIGGSIIFREGWGQIELRYFLPHLYGIVPTILAAIGILPALKRKETRLFIVWTIASLAIIYLFRAYSFSLFAPYQRMLYFCMLGMVPLSAMGLAFVVGHARNILDKAFANRRSISITAVILISFILAALSFHGYYSPPGESRLYHVIEDKDYAALMFSKNFGDYLIIVPPRMTTAVYPATGMSSIGITEGNLRSGNLTDVIGFYKGGCKAKESIIMQYQLDYVVSEDRIDCSFMKEVYNKSDYVYDILFDWG